MSGSGAAGLQQGRDYFQAAKPPHWTIEEDARLPNGRHLQGAKARVYQVLQLARDTCHRFPIGRHLAPAGWVPTWVLREPWAGGAAGDRRVRDLRVIGVAIAGKPFDAPEEDGSAAASASWIWRLSASESAAATTSELNPRKKSAARAARVPSGPLSGVLFILQPGPRPTQWRGKLVDISPGMPHVAAPPGHLAARVHRGELSHDDARELYRQFLLPVFTGGALARAFRAPGEVTICCEAPFDPLPVLGRALERLGAVSREEAP